MSPMLFCLFVLRFYGPVNPMGSCRAQSEIDTWISGRERMTVENSDAVVNETKRKAAPEREKYSITSTARTRMARLPWMIRTLFSVPTKFFQ